MKIDIDKLSEEELVDLNHRIVARLRFLNQMRAHSAMLDFRIGERVTFYPDGRPAVVGVITRYNKKSVTVITDSGQHWNVAPGLLRKASAPSSTETSNATVIQLRKESANRYAPLFKQGLKHAFANRHLPAVLTDKAQDIH
jgi:hypothetical protein